MITITDVDHVALVECHDEVHRYLATESTYYPDPAVRADFVGSAQFVIQHGEWT